MKKILLTIGLLSPLALVACASTTSQQGLKKSPCACVYKPISGVEYQSTDPFVKKVFNNFSSNSA